MQRLLIGFCALFSLAVHAAPLTPPKGGQYAVIVQGNNGVEFGSSRDPGKVEVDRQGAGKLVVAKHTTTITLLSPCIILILPPSGQVIPSSPKRFLPTIT
ncbi:hypothetical protein, partial [Aeromonas caviae]|uniref:hypothetical protein n=1 Tax=Aeromonas caviae TaxID=648 RepID=UPI001FC88707